MTSSLPDRLDRLAQEFGELDTRERLELLLEFSEKLAPLPPELAAERDAGLHRIAECQTPVFLWVRLDDGRVHVLADVAPEAPTVKGFVSLLVDLFEGCDPAEVLALESNLVQRFSLAEALGMVRLRGLAAITHYIRKHVANAAAA